MKARFALDLSESRIALLHRGASGWQPVGAVQLDDADLDMNIAALRARAEAYSGEAIRADVILPKELVLYMQLPRMPERDAEEHIEHALHGRTPYALHQLAYDYEFEDGMCLVAIVARETLREASEFAVGHGIEVASFAAAPDPDGDRRHIPNFPVSAMAEIEPAPIVVAEAPASDEAAELADEAAVENAAEEIAALAAAAAEEAAAAPEEVYGPVDMRAAASEEEVEEIEIPEGPEAMPETAPALMDEAALSAGDHDGAMRLALSRGDLGEIDDAAGEAEEDDHVISFGPASERAARSSRDIAGDFGAERRTIAESSSRISFSPVGGPERNLSLGSDSPFRSSMSDAAPGSFAARRAAIASITPLIDTPAPPAPSERSAFASQIELPKPETPRNEADAMTVFGARGVPEPRVVAARAMFAVAAAVVLLIGLGAFTASWLFGPDDPLGIEEPVALLPEPAPEDLLPETAAPLEVPVVTVDAAEDVAEEPVVQEPVLEVVVETPAEPAPAIEAAPAEPVELAETVEPEPASEIEVLDALIAETDAVIDEAAASEAVEAALAEALGLSVEDVATAEVEEAPVVTASARGAVPSLGEIVEQGEAAAEEAPALSEALVSATPRGGDLPRESDIVLPPQGDPSREAILASYAATGIWSVAPDVPRQPGETPVAVRLPQAGDAALRRAVGALAAPSGLGEQPASQLPPAGPGITFELDERGLVTATPEGTLNQDGVIVYTGAPVKRPPVRKEPEPDVRVIGAKPKARPEIDPETAARLEEANSAALLRFEAFEGIGPNGLVSGPEDVAVRALHEGRKPKARPGRQDSAAEAGAAPLSAEEAREALFRPDAQEVEDPTASGFAVAVSARPSARPKSIAASAAAAAAPVAPAAPQAATPAVVRQQPAPQLPTRASVARAATTPDAIKLRKVNLIGVYGTKTKRRALVRLANGRFLKVKVGDKMDGGVVQAISDNALQYQKGRKQLVIALPQT